MEINRGGSPSFESSNGSVQTVSAERLTGTYIRLVKPALDRILGLFLLIVALPVILIAGMVVLMSLGRPVFYCQERIGLEGRTFRLYKLRTMAPDRRDGQNDWHGHERRRAHKSPDDPRVSRVGQTLRASRVDELPQFWNVVKGDMSLVGPRPELPQIVNRYEPWQHQRHLIRPGVTGLWQVSPRNGRLMHECTELDLEYLHQVSLLQDLRILARTPNAMIGNRKGY